MRSAGRQEEDHQPRGRYHGVTIAAHRSPACRTTTATSICRSRGILHTDCPHHYRFAEDGETEEEFATRLAADLEELIQREGPDTIAAFIAEPVMGAGGVIVPPEGYFEVMAVCAKYDMFVIDDEVICGFGRLGATFGCPTSASSRIRSRSPRRCRRPICRSPPS